MCSEVRLMRPCCLSSCDQEVISWKCSGVWLCQLCMQGKQSQESDGASQRLDTDCEDYDAVSYGLSSSSSSSFMWLLYLYRE